MSTSEPFGAGKFRVISEGSGLSTKVEALQEDGTWVALRGVQSLKFGVAAGEFSLVTLELFMFQAHAEFLPENVVVNLLPPDQLSTPEREMVTAMRALPPTPHQIAFMESIKARIAAAGEGVDPGEHSG